MVMSTKTAPALVGRRVLNPEEPMVKLYILQGFALGGGRGDAMPGDVVDVEERQAKRNIQLGRARLATTEDMPKPKRKRLLGGDDDGAA